MQVDVHIIHAFSLDGKGGNPAGVVLAADQLTRDQKQQVAAQVGLSETAFVSASTVADVRLEFFTPTRQIAHCGHATIGTFSFLQQQGRITGNDSSKETIDGVRAIRFEGAEAYMQQTAPVQTSLDAGTQAEVLASLRLEGRAVAEPPVIINTGNGFLLVELNSEAVLSALDPDLDAIQRLSERFGLIGYYVFVREGVEGADAVARMFAPAYGIPEEAATGMAAGPLGCYLYARDPQGRRHFRILQGLHMAEPSPSLIKVEIEADGNGITRLFAGGTAYRARTVPVTI